MRGPPLPVIAVTMGDPAGIGPEIALKAMQDRRVLRSCQPRLLGAKALLRRVARRLSLPLPMPGQMVDTAAAGADAKRIAPGMLSAAAGRIAAAAIDAAISGCLDRTYAAMVTCPVNKKALQLAGIPFPGHTEWLAARCHRHGETMMLYHPTLAVALVTCHQSLMSVASSLSAKRIVQTALALRTALQGLGTTAPRLAILGLNPHAGEDGLFGSEERVVRRAVAHLRRAGMSVEGPLPPDTAFTPANRQRFDGWVCMYHDQGLIPFKALVFDQGVNVTLGLPLIRTSVDHGTAFDIAWTGAAEHESLVQALLLAARLSGQPRKPR